MKLTSVLNIDLPIDELWELFEGKVKEYTLVPDKRNVQNRCNLLEKSCEEALLKKQSVQVWETHKEFWKEKLHFVDLGDTTRIIFTSEIFVKNWLLRHFEFIYEEQYQKTHQLRMDEISCKLKV